MRDLLKLKFSKNEAKDAAPFAFQMGENWSIILNSIILLWYVLHLLLFVLYD